MNIRALPMGYVSTRGAEFSVLLLSWYSENYANCRQIIGCHTDLSAGTNDIKLKFCIWRPHSFVAACMERGDNLINFQRKKNRGKKISKQKTYRRTGRSDVTPRNTAKYPIVSGNVKCQSLLKHCKSFLGNTLSCIF